MFYWCNTLCVKNMYVKMLYHYNSDRTGKNATAIYICYNIIIKVKNEYTTGVNVDNGKEDITDGSIADHLTTRFIHVHICACEMTRSNNQLLTEKITITAFWDIMPCTVACKIK